MSKQQQQRKWIVVADASRARIYSLPTATAPAAELSSLLTLEVELEHPESRLKTSELTAGKNGRYLDSTSRASNSPGGRNASDFGQRSGWEPPVSAHEHEVEVFARKLIDVLDKARTTNRFDELVLIASPSFLGKLRLAMSPPLAKTVVHSVDKDLTFVKESDMPNRLGQLGAA